MTRNSSTQIPVKAKFLAEPPLLFADNGRTVDPKKGIITFGPQSRNSTRHPIRIRAGLIGSADSVDAARSWLTKQCIGVGADDANTPFPGFAADRGFFCDLVFSSRWDESLTRSELGSVTGTRSQKNRFEAATSLLRNKLRSINERDQAPDVVIAALPDSLVKRTRVADYRDKVRGQVHRDLRRAFKADAMRWSLPTQILLSRTVEGRKGVDRPSKCAWNFFTALYFKAGGVPWRSVGLRPDTCYIGIAFYRPLGTKSNAMRVSLAQAFDQHGEGLVLRGREFPWSDEDGPSPHLSAEQSRELLSTALARYRTEVKHTPQRVVVHKSSAFWPEERRGFEEVLTSTVNNYDLLAFSPTSELRLVRQGQYPPLRGTWFELGDLDFLYTTGFIPELKAYPHGHVPSPLRIADHIGGDTSREELLREILILTKLNWNSANLGGLMPITLRFSRRVGEIMREVPPQQEPKPQFKYYV